MEIELEPRVKPLPYKVKGMSRESPSQKAAHVLDTDLRSHWSTSTNTKEWILLELDEPCLLSHIRIYNKSVLEWEIAVGLSYKPETFVKVRPRCEAPRRDMIYPMNYSPCRYVRISCLRGNPIAIFFIQLIGVSVAGLVPEFQPVVSHLLPHIISHKQDVHDMHLQLLQDMTNRLLVFLPQLEADLASFSDDVESNLRFLAMLSGPFYPILHVVKERETAKSPSNISDNEVFKSSQSTSALTVSSNFEPRRSRGMSSVVSSTSSSIAFRQDVVFVLLRKAYKDSNLGIVCKKASRVLQNLTQQVTVQEAPVSSTDDPHYQDEISKFEVSDPAPMVDYSVLFGEDFQIPDDHWDMSILNILDLGAVEEGILHVLYACASQSLLCSKLAETTCDFWSALPLIQALLPALRPSMSSSSDHIDDSFSQWKQPFVQQALSQIVATSSSSLYQPLLRACTSYLSSFSPSHAKAACVLIDLCSGVLSPWIPQVVAKVDLIVELVEELLGTIQACHSMSRARAAIKYIMLALSGHMDDILGKYKEVKHKILFLFEMLDPFLHPAIYGRKSIISIGNASFTFAEKQKQNCATALNIIHTAVQKSAVLPSLESEWRLGSVTPSVLLSILDPHMELPPEIDLCKSSVSKTSGDEFSSKLKSQDVSDLKTDTQDLVVKMDVYEDASSFFAPQELQSVGLTNSLDSIDKNISDSNSKDSSLDEKHGTYNILNKHFPNSLVLDAGFAAEYFNLQADYLQLMNFRDCELRASEFRRLASDLHSQYELSAEGHDAAIDALLLAAECYVNPFSSISTRANSNVLNQMKMSGAIVPRTIEISKLRKDSGKNSSTLETVAVLEKKRDKIVLQLLLEAAELDLKYQKQFSEAEHDPNNSEAIDEQVIRLAPCDIQSADAVTLVRQNQALLCNFLIQRLQRQQHSMHEILMHCLVFFLHSATKLYCAPELVIGIILESAGYLNRMLSSFYEQLKEGILQLSPEKIHGVQRRWMLLQRLVIASSGGDNDSDFSPNSSGGFQHGNLIPPSAWMQKTSMFSGCEAPLVRFLGWMAVSRNAKQFLRNQVFLVSDLSQLTYLLSVFADELALVDNIVDRDHGDLKIAQSGGKQTPNSKGFELAGQQHGDQTFRVIYPYLSKFFPNMRKQFESFGETILEAVGMQLRSLPSSIVPDILCWFSDLCSWPFLQKDQIRAQGGSEFLKGFVAKNAKAVILYVLEAIVVEHMEALVPEMPRVVQVLISLCRSSYCDVSFLDSILHILKPIISYSLCEVPNEEQILVDDSCLNFESLCFNELFLYIRQKTESEGISAENANSRALTIFILASVFPDLSFQRRREMLQSLILWTDFCGSEPTASFHDYLFAFVRVMESCKVLLLNTLKSYAFIPIKFPLVSDAKTTELPDQSSVSNSWFLDNTAHNSCQTYTLESDDGKKCNSDTSSPKNWYLSIDEIGEFTRDLEALIPKLYPTIELCWSLHLQLAKNLTIISAQCLVYSRCLSSVAPAIQEDKEDDSGSSLPFESAEDHWKSGLEGLAGIIAMLQENHCWEVASLILDCLLGVPHCFQLDNVIDTVCSAIQKCSCSAPKVAWRLQTDKWLSVLLARGVVNHRVFEIPLVDLFCMMLGHPEPEQRFIALRNLGKLVGQDMDGELVSDYSTFCSKLVSPSLRSSNTEPITTILVSSLWDRVVALASSDASSPLRIRAMALLVDFIPYAGRQQLQSLLMSSDNVLHGFGKLAHPVGGGPLLQLSLALIAGACLYSLAEDISLIPRNVWRDIETLGLSETGGKVGDLEKKACQVLCKLRDEGEDVKEALREALSSNASKSVDPDFGTTRESILQVLASLTSVESYFEMFSSKIDEENMELEEAEMELDIIQKERSMQESSRTSYEGHQLPIVAACGKDDSRLQQIKDSILSLEKSRLREEIVAHRQKKLLMRRSRQKYREEAAAREAELLQQLDRERTAEMEKEIERQRLLELERAKTRELRHNLDMEKERQTQRELQRELEHAESGLRSSRRDFSSSHSSRSRDRYRERENGRAGAEGTTRGSTSNLQQEISSSSSALTSMPAIVLSGSRSFSGQTPTILQSRDRSDDCGSSYEENFDGSKDSGDTGSIGDPELMSAFEGQSGAGFGSGQRHGSRGSKSRQVSERRERDGRREGKWERKH